LGCYVLPVPKPSAIPGARTTLVLSLVLSFIGICGLMRGYGFVSVTADDLDRAAETNQVFAARRNLDEAETSSPVLVGVQVGNLLASGLLLFASVLLTARRRSALWWTQQALIANILYTLANIATMTWFSYGHASLVRDTYLALDWPADVPVLISHVLGTAFFGLLMLTLYLVLFRVLRRADVREFVQREAS